MQKGKSLQYVVAGIQDMPDIRIRMSGTAFLPDSEAGRFDEMDRKPFHASQVREQPKTTWDVPRNAALIFLCALFLLFGLLILNKSIHRSALSKDISAMENSIAQLGQDNAQLAIEVAQARDRTRIDDLAIHVYQMTAPEKVVPTWVTAPDTRPFEQKTTLQAEASPNSLLEGKKSGSR